MRTRYGPSLIQVAGETSLRDRHVLEASGGLCCSGLRRVLCRATALEVRLKVRKWIVGVLAAVLALSAIAGVVAQEEPPAPETVDVDVTVWRLIADPSLLYVSTRPEGGRWRTLQTPLDMSAVSTSGNYNQSNAVRVRVPVEGGGTVNVDVTVWRLISDPSLLYVSTRPEGGRWRTLQTPLDMSAVSTSGNYHQSNAVRVEVPLPGPPPAAECVQRDRDALVAFYNSLDGPNWRSRTGWLSERPLGTWRGVGTNAGGCVTSIELDGNDLSGTIPSEVGALSSLTVLDLSENNDITGALPPELGNLSNLVELNLADQSGQSDRTQTLTGGIPPELGNLTNLVSLNLSWHQLSGDIPSELGNITNLQTLNLAGNRNLGGEIPPELGDLAHLRSLRLNHNDLRGAIPAELGQLSDLRALFLTSNSLDGAIPEELGDLARLGGLYLGNNALSGAIPAALGNLSRLGTLDLRDNHLSGDVPSELANLSALHSYYFHGNPLTGCIPDSFRSLRSAYATYAFDDPRPDPPPFCEATVSCATGTAVPNASANPGLVSDCESLVAARDAIAGTGTLNWSSTTPIARWTGIGLGGSPQRVKSLELTGFDGEIPAELGDLDELETLVFKRPPFAGARYRSAGAPSLAPLEAGMRGEIPSELGRLSELRELKLGFNELSGEIPPQLGDLAKLRELDLHRNNLTGDVPSQLGNLNDLTVLDLSANELGGPIPPELGNLAKLTFLHLAANDLTGAIPPQLSNLTRLTQLKLGFNDLTGAIPPQLGDLTRLRNLDLGPNRLTGQIPPELGALTGLSTLDLSYNLFTGEIPTALGNLTGLRILLLNGNQLTGCIPVEWEDVGFTFTDLAGTSLPYCP